MNVPPASANVSKIRGTSSGAAPYPHRVPKVPAPSASEETRKPLLRPKVKCCMRRTTSRSLSLFGNTQIDRSADIGKLEQAPALVSDLFRAGGAENRRGKSDELLLELLVAHRVVGRAEVVCDMPVECASVAQRQHDARRVFVLSVI